MKTVMEISKMSDPPARCIARCTIAAVCSALYLKEALDWAAKNGGTTGENVAKWASAQVRGLGAGRNGGRLHLDLDREGSPPDHEGRPSSPRRSLRATDGDINDLAGKGTTKLDKREDRSAAAQAEQFRLVARRSPSPPMLSPSC